MAEGVYQHIIQSVSELRKSILLLAITIVCGTVGFYFLTSEIFLELQQHLDQKLSFFSVTEPFLSHLKLAFFVTLFSFMPLIMYCFWRALAKPFGLSTQSLVFFVLSTSFLFYSGALFCYFITLPFGVDFLLGFESEQLKPVIAIGKFVTFVTVFILAFGVIFELPIFMVFGAKTGMTPRSFFEKNRRYAVLIMSVVAALLTPTPDIVNMLLMGVPLYMLYEMGILLLKVLRI
ncbi:MAG: twin-arginine translocase subunit TatC [Desulfobulbaceae bacterium]|nr:twin-arginine translocase subunit TatC [Desulfobulbaceae bacterium]